MDAPCAARGAVAGEAAMCALPPTRRGAPLLNARDDPRHPSDLDLSVREAPHQLLLHQLRQCGTLARHGHGRAARARRLRAQFQQEMERMAHIERRMIEDEPRRDRGKGRSRRVQQDPYQRAVL
jgi:hypothetical protein